MKEHKYVNFNQEADVHYIINKYHKKEHEAVFALIEKNLKFKKIEK